MGHEEIYGRLEMYDLKTLSDRIEVEEHIFRYPHLLDSGRIDEVAEAIFVEDAVLEFGDLRFEGRNEIGDIFLKMTATLNGTSHNVTNVMIVLDGDTAKANFRILAWHWMRADSDDPIAEQQMLAVGGYEDELVRTAEGWRVKYRRSYALGTGIGIGHPVPMEFRNFMETLSHAKISWR